MGVCAFFFFAIILTNDGEAPKRNLNFMTKLYYSSIGDRMKFYRYRHCHFCKISLDGVFARVMCIGVLSVYG